MAAISEQVDNEGVVRITPSTINKLDLVSIEAMICYTANRVQAHETFILRTVLAHFKISDLKKLPRSKSNAVIQYLTDYRVPANSR